jgi:hypothetical protein
LDVKLSDAERKALERITGGRVLQDARLEVKMQVKVRKAAKRLDSSERFR